MDQNLNKCNTCLCGDRQLMCVSQMHSIVNEIHLFKILNIKGSISICWECHKYIENFHKFVRQAKRAQNEISRNIENVNIKSLSSLTVNTKQYYDYEFIYCDPLLCINDYPKNKVKIEPKQEPGYPIELENYNSKSISDSEFENLDKSKPISDSVYENLEKSEPVSDSEFENLDKPKSVSDSDSDDEPLSAIFAEKISEKQDLTIIKEKSIIDIRTDILKDTFEMVVLTDEEMLRSREEKQNQPSFKRTPFKCDSCVMGFLKEEHYTSHMAKKHEKNAGPHICNVCQTRFTSKLLANDHISRHYVLYKCRLCDYQISLATAAITHARAKHADDREDRIHCKQCDFVASTAKEISEHVSVEHLFVCKECGVKFKHKSTLRAHLTRIHSVNREFVCEVCSRTFPNKSRLETHSARHSAALAASLSYCAACRVQYKSVHVYRNHLKSSPRHVQDKISCPDCGKKFSSKHYWSQHYNFYHLGKSQHKCVECNKIFISEFRLKLHKQVNHGLTRTRDHACTQCPKKFFTKATLTSHSLLHGSARAFMCATCGDTFRQSAALYTHTRLLHKNK